LFERLQFDNIRISISPGIILCTCIYIHSLVLCMYFAVYVYVCDHVRPSISGLLIPLLSCGFFPLNLRSFILTSITIKRYITT